jgi:hypothetical protein
MKCRNVRYLFAAIFFILSGLFGTIFLRGTASGGEIDFSGYLRDTSFFKARSIEEIENVTESLTHPYSAYPLHDRYAEPEEVYISFYPGDMTFHFGFQKYLTETGGWGWTPADLFNPKKTFDPFYKGEASTAAYFSYLFPTGSFPGAYEISGFYSFGNRDDDAYPNIKDGDYQVRMKAHTDVLDLAIHYSEITREESDYEGMINGSVPSEAATVPVRWRLLTAGVSSEIGRLGLHAEGGRAWLDSKDDEKGLSAKELKDHSKFLIGMDYTFENELYLVLEYYQDGQGKSSPQEYSLNDRLAYLNGERSVIGRDNVFVGAKYPIARMTSVELYNIINANDPSVIVNPWLVWGSRDLFSVKFSAQFPVGKKESAVGQTKPSAFAHIQLNF